MAALTHLSIVTPSALRFEGDAELVVAPGAAGDLGALANHAPMLTTLRTGVVSATVVGERPGGQGTAAPAPGRIQFAVNGGFMQILPDHVVILTDHALSRDEIDVEVARADLKRAEEALGLKRGADDTQERRDVAWAHARLAITARPL
jgi:F-type H+-transporting ATPase subunit epsilon